jgi:F1F0 ATPase subunit 2
MNDSLTLTLTLTLTSGLALGALFFGGLWWTIKMAARSAQPALWFFCSMWVRTSITLAGFYFVASGSWEKMLMCGIGFAGSRAIVTWFTKRPGVTESTALRGAKHAS